LDATSIAAIKKREEDPQVFELMVHELPETHVVLTKPVPQRVASGTPKSLVATIDVQSPIASAEKHTSSAQDKRVVATAGDNTARKEEKPGNEGTDIKPIAIEHELAQIQEERARIKRLMELDRREKELRDSFSPSPE
jgi:hypothetical protein